MVLRKNVLVVALLGGLCLLARAAALDTGFIVDDFAQLNMMNGTYLVPRSPLGLFTFSSGQAAENQTLRDHGFFPWWTDPQLRVSLFRPLSSALMWLDKWLWEYEPFKYHLHSAAWWFCMVSLWGLLLRNILQRSLALVAFACVLCHPAHTMLLGWVANRNASVAMFFALLGLWTQLRSRQAGAFAPWTTALAYALALAAGEYALGMVAYSVAYEFVGDASRMRERRMSRAFALVGTVLGYAAVRSSLGFGAARSGMYIDPSGEPGAYLAAAGPRLLALSADLVFGMRSNWWSAGYPWSADLVQWLDLPSAWAADLRPWRTVQEGLGAMGLLVVVAVCVYCYRSRPELRFLVVGLPVSLLTAAGSLPESRLLLPAVFSWSVIAVTSAATLTRGWRSALGARRTAATTLVALLLVETLSAVEQNVTDLRYLPGVSEAIRRSILTPKLDPSMGSARTALLISAVDPTTTIYIPLARRLYGRPTPQSCHLLFSTFDALRLTRVSANRFSLARVSSGLSAMDVYAAIFNRAQFRQGQRFRVAGMDVTVDETSAGLLRSASFELDVSLDDPSIVILQQTAGGLETLKIPDIGASLLIAPPMLPLSLVPARYHIR